MRYATVCSGIGAPEVAWAPLGWESAWMAEVDPFCCSLIEQRFPGVPNLGDITAEDFIERARTHGPVDLICGGTPCQSFSVAGLRGGLADARGNLALRFLQIADALRPRWLVWENVPGVLSSNGGRDFGAIVGGMVECGYGVAYRVLDAQYFGVAQRRRRVFVVGCLGDWRLSAAVLFERDCLSGNPPPSREKGSTVAHCLAAGAGGGKFGTGRDGQDDFVISHTLKSRAGSNHDATHETYIAHTLKASNGSEDGTGRGVPLVPVADTLTANWSKSNGAKSGNNVGLMNPVLHSVGVRRLTPRECERLQGFPDDWTAIQYRGRHAADAPRYKAIGNSMAVPVVRWLGWRIEAVERKEE